MQVRQCPKCQSQNVAATRERDAGQPICRCLGCGFTANVAEFDLADFKPLTARGRK